MANTWSKPPTSEDYSKLKAELEKAHRDLGAWIDYACKLYARNQELKQGNRGANP